MPSANKQPKHDQKPQDVTKVNMPYPEVEQEVLFEKPGLRWMGSLKTGDSAFDEKDFGRVMFYDQNKIIIENPKLMKWCALEFVVGGGCFGRLNYNDWKDPGEIWRLAQMKKKNHEWHDERTKDLNEEVLKIYGNTGER